MEWWEEKHHVLIRERHRIKKEFPENDFIFLFRNNDLWLIGTLLNFFEFELKYPSSYPFSPPEIFPKDNSTKWVPKHQYIKKGRFCLNIRETWNSTLSAADIIKSLENLLVAEEVRKIREEDKLIVYEENEPTKLQRRFIQHRCIIPADIQFPIGEPQGIFKFILFFRESKLRIIVSGIKGFKKDDKYNDSILVKTIWGKIYTELVFNSGLWLRTSFNNIFELLYLEKYTDLETILKTKYFMNEEITYEEFANENSKYNLLMYDEKYPNSFFYLEVDQENNSCTPFGTYLLNLINIFNRLPNREEYSTLKNKKVSIIGCGSGGSKIAEYLIKAGIENITLIDGDYLTTENIIRHLCQLDDIDLEKVYAVKNKLIKINPNANITPIFKKVEVIEPDVDEAIKNSDLLVIATAANEELFNNYAFSRGIPAIYAKVYPLGFGGEIIRTIPGLTPCYECLNYQKELFIEKEFEGAVFPNFNTTTYDTTEEGEQIPIPALAVDADFIVLITAKMAIELLVQHEDVSEMEITPNIRLWGNKKEWIFDQDYQCFSIDNHNLKSFNNCLVCFGNETIENELGINSNIIDTEYSDLIKTITKENTND